MFSRFLSSPLGNTLFVLLLIAVSVGTYRMVRDAVALNTEDDELSRTMEDFTVKKETLESRLAELQTAEVMEREAKERLNLKNLGERVVVVVPSEEVESESFPAYTWWQNIKRFFGFSL